MNKNKLDEKFKKSLKDKKLIKYLEMCFGD